MTRSQKDNTESKAGLCGSLSLEAVSRKLQSLVLIHIYKVIKSGRDKNP